MHFGNAELEFLMTSLTMIIGLPLLAVIFLIVLGILSKESEA